MIATNKLKEITFDQDYMYLHFIGKTFKVEIGLFSPKLLIADSVQRNFFKVSPSGYGIHWPLIDEDLSIDSLLKASA